MTREKLYPELYPIPARPLKSHLGASFVNAAGECIECWQLLNESKRAVAVADFRNGKLERFEAAAPATCPAQQWLSDLQRTITQQYGGKLTDGKACV